MYTDKIFSKPKDYQPVFQLRDKKGIQSFEDGVKSDQFVSMLSNFRSMLYDRKKIINERNRILLRAKLMDEIFQFGNKYS